MKTQRDCLFPVALAAVLSNCVCVSLFAQTNSTNSAKIPAQSFLGMGGVTTIPERRASPHFVGKELPQPPQQKSPWTAPPHSLPTNYVTATILLFEQGMADPRGCDYREIEVGTGNVWDGDGGMVKTRGWVLPGKGDQRFAVCWNGLVYPVVTVREPADFRADAQVAIQKSGRMWQNALPEGFTVSHETSFAIKGCLLLRLGESDLAKQMWAGIQIQSGKGVNFDVKPNVTIAEVEQAKLTDADPYLGWASDWAWGLFERTVTAHMRGDDGLALASARLLTWARPQVEASAEQRGFKRQQTYNSPWDGKYQDYLNFLDPLPALLTDQERRAQRREPIPTLEDVAKTTNQAAQISALIDQLDQVATRQWGQPGGLGSWEFDPIVGALQKEGAPAIEPLLQCLEGESCNRLTRSVSFGRDFHRGRWLHSVAEPVNRMLHNLLGAGNFGSWATTNELAAAGTNGNRIAAAQIRAWMRKFQGNTPEERWYVTLRDDNAGKGLWMDAAGNITKQIRPGSRDTTNQLSMQGERLRTKANPSVTELMERRVRETITTNFPSTMEFYYFADSCGFALTFSRWDAKGSLPTLRWLMNIARDFSDSTNWFMIGYGQERFISALVNLTLARIDAGDKEALNEYAKWLESRQPSQAFIDGRSPTGSNGARLDQLKPAWMFPDDPAIISALEKLLDDTNSPWRPALAGQNGTIGLAGHLAATPLLTNAVVCKYMLAGLAEKAHAGDITFGTSPFTTNDISVNCKFDAGWGTSGTVKRNDKLPEDTTKPMSFRVCDLFAEQLASVDGLPPFDKSWSLKERDDAIAAIVKFIEKNGDKLSELVEKKRKREWWKSQ